MTPDLEQLAAGWLARFEQASTLMGLWLIAGSFAQCRIYSKYLALQILADELGMLPERRSRRMRRERRSTMTWLAYAR